MVRLITLVLIIIGLTAQAAEEKSKKKGSRQPVQASNTLEVPVHPFDIILGRPTSKSITMNILCYEDTEGSIVYGTESGNLIKTSLQQRFPKGVPTEIELKDLQPNTLYFYRFRTAKTTGTESRFHTARSPGNPFTFTLTADPHLDANTDPAVYRRTLLNALADRPDFHIDLGDTFMTEKHSSREMAEKQYLAQRYYFGQLCHSTPLFLVLGNHDGEYARGRGKDSEGLAVWSNQIRKRYFPNPIPDEFYSGNTNRHSEAGLLQDYYAWEWGDGLFIGLDPYWFVQEQRGHRDNWKQSLGKEQYQWLEKTLKQSRARFKFIFIHNLVGGLANQSRGGIEAVPFFEWGGKNADGSNGFASNRPGWKAPIHDLLVKNQVTAVFHGHDHLYANQQCDGVVYQAVPQPGYPGNGKSPRSAAEYGYLSGKILGSSGHLRVEVSSKKITLTYLLSNGSQAHAYDIFYKDSSQTQLELSNPSFRPR